MDLRSKSGSVLHRFRSMRPRMIAEGVLVGAAAGSISILYRYMLGKADEWRSGALEFCSGSWKTMLLWAVVLVVAGLLVAALTRWEPMISGSGIPQVEAEMAGYLKPVWWRVILGKLAGGFLCIFGGLSLGREGPSIQLGGMTGKGISRLLGRFRLEEHFLITCGASAGLSAAFNAPLAGVMFALEEVHRNFSAVIMLSCMAASLTADFVSKYIFGLEPVFRFAVEGMIPLESYAIVIGLGLLCGVLGAFYNKVLLASQTAYKKLKFLSQRGKILLPFLCAAVLGFTMPQVLGGGHEMIELLTDGDLVLSGILILLAAKFLFSMVSFGSGAPGGIFFPLLVLGAYIGGAYGTALMEYLGMNPAYYQNLIIIAMAALFASIVRAPITGIVLISEMTGSFSHLLTLSIASLISYIVADLLGSAPVYESLTERLLANNNIRTPEAGSRNKTICQVVVEAGSEVDGQLIRNLSLPSGLLIVSVQRGGDEIIPKGNTRIHAGDTIAVMVSEADAAAMSSVLRHMTSMKEG